MDEFGEQHFRLTDANAAGALWASHSTSLKSRNNHTTHDFSASVPSPTRSQSSPLSFLLSSTYQVEDEDPIFPPALPESTAFSPFIVPLRQGGSVQVLGVLYKPVSVVYTDGVTCTSGPPPSDTPTIFQPSTQFHEHGGLNMHKTEQQEAPRFAPHVTASLPGHARRQQGFVCPAHIHGNVGDDASIANGNDTPSGHMLKSAKTLPHDASDDGDSGDVDEQEKDGETEEHEQENGKGIDEDDEMTFMCADGEALGNTDEDSRKNSAPLSSTAGPYSDEHAGSQPGRDSTYTAGSSAAAALHHADIADHDFSEALRAIMDASDQEIETAMLAVFNHTGSNPTENINTALCGVQRVGHAALHFVGPETLHAQPFQPSEGQRDTELSAPFAQARPRLVDVHASCVQILQHNDETANDEEEEELRRGMSHLFNVIASPNRTQLVRQARPLPGPRTIAEYVVGVLRKQKGRPMIVSILYRNLKTLAKKDKYLADVLKKYDKSHRAAVCPERSSYKILAHASAFVHLGFWDKKERSPAGALGVSTATPKGKAPKDLGPFVFLHSSRRPYFTIPQEELHWNAMFRAMQIFSVDE